MRLSRLTFLTLFLVTPPAWAGMFAGIGGFFTAIFESIKEDLALPVTLAAIGWALLASLLRLGGIVLALSTAIAGVMLYNLDTIVESAMHYVGG